MAKFGFSNYEINTDTDKQGGGGGGLLPHMYARLWAESIDFPPTDDKKGNAAKITFEVQDPEEFRGRKMWADWVMLHADQFNHGRYKYGKPMFDRFCRAVDVMPTEDTDYDEFLFKSFVAEIGINEGGLKKDGSGEKYKDRNQIEQFFYEDEAAAEKAKEAGVPLLPELGLIGDGSHPTKAAGKPKPAANDNKPAAAAKPAASGAAGKPLPWGKKAA